jgi:hypothetical protein
VYTPKCNCPALGWVLTALILVGGAAFLACYTVATTPKAMMWFRRIRRSAPVAPGAAGVGMVAAGGEGGLFGSGVSEKELAHAVEGKDSSNTMTHI